MPEVEATKADSTAAPKKAAVVKKAKKVDGVEVKNISGRVINTSKGSIAPGKTGLCSIAEANQLHAFLRVVK